MELTAWYKEVLEEGHPDKKDGWIKLTDIPSLVQILATIAWVGCGPSNSQPCKTYTALCANTESLLPFSGGVLSSASS